jgi:hypothetical protein
VTSPGDDLKVRGQQRGMSWWHDCIDRLGGYPCESGSREEIVSFLEARGFRLTAAFDTTPPFGLFVRAAPPATAAAAGPDRLPHARG